MMEKIPVTIISQAWETHCEECGAEYTHIGHPLKSGVPMMAVCKCNVVTEQVGPGMFITRKIPPEKK